MNKRISLIIKGSVLALIITLLLSLLLATGIYFLDISDTLMSTIVFVIAAISCISGAYAISRTIRSKGLITGGILGIAYYIIIVIAAIIIKKDFLPDSHSLIMLICALASGMLGGVLGIPKE